MGSARAIDSRFRFLDLWPTILIRRRLDGHEQPNADLIALIEDMDRESEQLTTRYKGVDFLGIDNTGVRWLRAAIDETLDAYFAQSGMDYAVHRNVQCWPNVNRFGDYHPPHNHAWSYLSGTYYVKLPSDGSGAISFYDPRAMVNMLLPDAPRAERPEYTLHPEPGTLLLWHSSLNHLVHPNVSEETRISISFNIVLEWSNEYA